MLVNSILQRKGLQGVVTISPDAEITKAAQLLAEHRIGALVALDGDGNLKGILSERDIVRGLGQHEGGALSLKVSDLMTANVYTCRGDEPALSILQTMTEKRIRHVPVLDENNRLKGIITIGDAVKSRLDEMDMEVDNLRHYVATSR